MSISFLVRIIVLVSCFSVSFWALQALNFEKSLKANHVQQAQVLYWLMAMALGWLSAQFILSLVYTI